MQISRVHIILFLITIATTFLAGFFQNGDISGGVSFSAALLFILGAHEMGHYALGRKYGVDITAPYFIPAPPLLSPIGTFGAFIKIRSPISTKRALFDIGIAGPLVGIIAAIPVIIIGVKLSTIIQTTGGDEIRSGLNLGTPLIFSFLSDTVLGEVPDGYDLLLHPVAFAGWIGLFITALNLIPSGQLDGGHIMYSLFSQKWYRRTSFFMIFALLILGVGTRPIIDFIQSVWKEIPFGSYRDMIVFEGWPGWFLWAGILSVMKPKHPPTMDDETHLDGKRKFLGFVALLVFIGCFTPVPISVY